MEKVIIDIGSGNIKSYIIKNNDDIVSLYSHRIMLKENFHPNIGLSFENKEQLFDIILHIKNLISPCTPIFIYATSIFRIMKPKIRKQFKEEFKNKTGLTLNVLSQEQENEFIASSPGKLPFSDPYLVCCIGGSSTEMAVIHNNKILENITVEFANADMINHFPELKEDYSSVDISVLEKYVYDNMIFPKTKCKNAIMVGWHLLQTTIADLPLKKNTFFNDPNIPYYLDTNTYLSESENIILHSNLQNFKNKIPDDAKVFSGFRGCCAITRCLLKEVETEYYFPTNLNMIHGIMKTLNS